MRRGLAIVVAMLVSWTLVLPAFSIPVESNLPACCRRAGKHHCTMDRAQAQQLGQSLATLTVKCPYFPHFTMSGHHEAYTGPSAAFFYAELVCHPAQAPQTEADHRISFNRSRQKRGPPVLPNY
jgi:hypothetical protein